MNPIFKSCSRNAVLALLERLKTQIYLRGDCMVRLGDIGKEMFFVLQRRFKSAWFDSSEVQCVKSFKHFENFI